MVLSCSVSATVSLWEVNVKYLLSNSTELIPLLTEFIPLLRLILKP